MNILTNNRPQSHDPAAAFAERLWSAEASYVASGWHTFDQVFTSAAEYLRGQFLASVGELSIRSEHFFYDVPRASFEYLIQALPIGRPPNINELVRLARVANQPLSLLEVRRALLVPLTRDSALAYGCELMDLHARRTRIAELHAEIMQLADVDRPARSTRLVA